MEDLFGHRISYLRVSITDRCNERCVYCMPDENQSWLPREGVLRYEEILRLIRVAVALGVSKVRITGGEPLVRRDVEQFFAQLARINGLKEIGVSTNGTLLARTLADGTTMAQHLQNCRVGSVNISLDTLDRAQYRELAGRDYLCRVMEGIEAARMAGFSKLKLNSVLVRGRTDAKALAEFARQRGLLLRFIELMPVSSREVLDEATFLPVRHVLRELEEEYGSSEPDATSRGNGPAFYRRFPATGQVIGFIGAMTDLHFCESCNKLRLTCDGKLRPCLGSWLEFDIMKPLREGASDEELARFFHEVVMRKPKEHDFREGYLPNRKMVAIGG